MSQQKRQGTDSHISYSDSHISGFLEIQKRMDSPYLVVSYVEQIVSDYEPIENIIIAA